MVGWSLGVFGDLLWDTLPDLRPAIAELVCEHVRFAAAAGEPIEPPAVNDLMNHVIGPLLDDLERGSEPAGSAAALGRFIRRLLSYDGPDVAVVGQDLDLYLMESVDTALLLPKLLAADPALGPALRRRWPDRTWPAQAT
jgi:hypothetical protein